MNWKERIIKKLGGYTQEEFESNNSFNYISGEINSMDRLITFAKSLHGRDGNTWSEAMWKKLLLMKQDLQQQKSEM